MYCKRTGVCVFQTSLQRCATGADGDDEGGGVPVYGDAFGRAGVRGWGGGASGGGGGGRVSGGGWGSGGLGVRCVYGMRCHSGIWGG